MNQPIPGRGHGIKGSGENKDEGAVGDSGETATLQGAGADGFKGEHAKQLAETVDGFVEQWAHRFRGAIAAGQPCSAGGDHNVNRRIGDPAADIRSDLVAVVRTNGAFAESMTGRLETCLKVSATGILRQGPRVGNGQEGDRQAHVRIVV